MAAAAAKHLASLQGRAFIHGSLRTLSGPAMALINPATGAPLGSCAHADAATVHAAVTSAEAAMAGPWAREYSDADRASVLTAVARALEAGADDLAA